MTVLHTLRCIGYAELPRVSRITGLTEPDAESELIDLAVAGLVTRTKGELGGGWGLTEPGRAEDARRTAAELEDTGARPAVTEAYQRFLVLNPELLDLCSAWQMRVVEGFAEVNDHTDKDYDARVLARFADLDRRADPVCAELTEALPRFGGYRIRLTAALDRVHAGDREYLADGLESYHAVWFQLHEDLLATLGIPR
ncbi:hypothetical protein FB565_002209 [Actinoplanes lutulentus]|uniref:Transcriptional regulator n=1 Tax=Actinoplanes lutulentus TaxID=1287878 RepID=A0A327ZL19_9ACTN|nr:transcriptional regulator [Actinoplanes lutulentus]MBB2942496.1 hypothetical protein [Actinoplanes lutulentus]RAK38077.1 hypothetical protein B0I29_10520 [Actinoplanes lutulentus]